ncbi:hypothetical protein [Salinigranum sp. GCM10025319]|uniref:hypothetical protein n=1 Tax=Salinigranum sp. GCM10025319 TaxID=3252687 RepID=UPI00361EA9CA
MIQPLDDPSEARATEPPTESEPADDEVPDTEPDEAEALDAEPPTPEPAKATDGGNPAFDGPDPDPSVEHDDGDDEPDTLDCPKCGDDLGANADELEDGKTYRCSSCRGTFRWSQ